MRQHEVSEHGRLDAKLAVHAMRKHEHLWHLAEGRFGWRESVALVLPLLLVAAGLVKIIREVGLAQYIRETDGTAYIALGAALLASFLWSYRQRQMNALLELVKRLEHGRL